MIDPLQLAEIIGDGREFLYNIPEVRGEGSVELHRIDAAGQIVPPGSITASAFIARLNEACRTLGARLCLYFYAAPLDGAVLAAFPDVANLHIASFGFATPEAIGGLPKLERLTWALLSEEPLSLAGIGVGRLRELTLVETPRRKLDLASLADARRLERLRLMGQYRNVAAIAALSDLRELVLYPAKRLDLGFVEAMGGLEVLKFAIGSMETLASLRGHATLRDLSFEWVSLLSDLGDLQRFPRLERLRMGDQKRLSRIVTGAGNTHLRHLWLGNLPALQGIEGLGEMRGLVSLFAHSTGLALPALDLPPSLTHLQLVPRTVKGRAEADAAIRARGLTAAEHPDAGFFYK